MAVYVDPLMSTEPSTRWPFTKACHMIADSLDDLHRFAGRLGLRREWFQENSTLPHYDLTANKRKLAVRLGAREITFHEIAARYQSARRQMA